MNNVLIHPLPDEWNGYKINTWFQVGIQVSLIYYDEELTNLEKSSLIIELLFEDEDDDSDDDGIEAFDDESEIFEDEAKEADKADAEKAEDTSESSEEPAEDAVAEDSTEK